MKIFLNIIRWVGFGFFTTMSLGGLISGGWGFLSAVLFLISAFLIAPLGFISKLREKLKLNKVITIIIAVVLFFVAIFIYPVSEEPAGDEGDNSSASVSSSAVNDTFVENLDNSSEETSSQITSSEQTTSEESSEEETNSSEQEESSSAPSSTTSSSKPSTSTSKPSSSTTSSTVHKHSYSAATCTKPQTCACGATTGSAKGHKWKEATYTAPKTCSACGATEGSAVAVPHSENYHGHVYTGGAYSKKFHYEAHCAGDNSHEITWDEVSRRGLTACNTCVTK